MPQADIEVLWRNISSPSLMVYGKESWASDPRKDGRAQFFRNATFVQIAGAGHWVHHDQLETFMSLVEPFTKGAPMPHGVPGVS
jgi:pimeloyl-ACP methyl ester carboxylesterase